MGLLRRGSLLARWRISDMDNGRFVTMEGEVRRWWKIGFAEGFMIGALVASAGGALALWLL